MKYRIVEETGNLTGNKRFYIQEQKKKWFSKGYYWKAVYGEHGRLAEFKSKEKAEYWINNRIETVKNIYHKTN